jgi:hypothetical protein
MHADTSIPLPAGASGGGCRGASCPRAGARRRDGGTYRAPQVPPRRAVASPNWRPSPRINLAAAAGVRQAACRWSAQGPSWMAEKDPPGLPREVLPSWLCRRATPKTVRLLRRRQRVCGAALWAGPARRARPRARETTTQVAAPLHRSPAPSPTASTARARHAQHAMPMPVTRPALAHHPASYACSTRKDAAEARNLLACCAQAVSGVCALNVYSSPFLRGAGTAHTRIERLRAAQSDRVLGMRGRPSKNPNTQNTPASVPTSRCPRASRPTPPRAVDGHVVPVEGLALDGVLQRVVQVGLARLGAASGLAPLAGVEQHGLRSRGGSFLMRKACPGVRSYVGLGAGGYVGPGYVATVGGRVDGRAVARRSQERERKWAGWGGV